MKIINKDKIIDTDDYVHLHFLDYSSQNREETLGITIFNGENLNSNVRANEEDGWVEMHCVDVGTSASVDGDNYRFIRDKNSNVMTYKIYGDVILLKLTNMGELILK